MNIRVLIADDHEVVRMGLRMPGMDGIAACRAIREFNTDVKVLMLTSYSDEQAVMSSVMAGATGYLIKNTPRAQLIAAVRAAAKGESTLDTGVADTPD
jgi:DNA-binding NarL/FixJ family response regulator